MDIKFVICEAPGFSLRFGKWDKMYTGRPPSFDGGKTSVIIYHKKGNSFFIFRTLSFSDTCVA